jgi:flagellar basal body-associated protein FliL
MEDKKNKEEKKLINSAKLQEKSSFNDKAKPMEEPGKNPKPAEDDFALKTDEETIPEPVKTPISDPVKTRPEPRLNIKPKPAPVDEPESDLKPMDKIESEHNFKNKPKTELNSEVRPVNPIKPDEALEKPVGLAQAQPTQEPEIQEDKSKKALPLDPNMTPLDKKQLEKAAKKTLHELGDSSSGSKKLTIVIIILLLLSILALAGFWAYSKNLIPGLGVPAEPAPTTSPVMESPMPSPEAKDDMTQELLNQSSSDEVSSIEQDLNNTDLSNIDQELTDIQQELETP